MTNPFWVIGLYRSCWVKHNETYVIRHNISFTLSTIHFHSLTYSNVSLSYM